MKKHISESMKQSIKKILFPTPSHLVDNQIQIDTDELNKIEKSIRANYHQGWRSEDKYSKQVYKDDLDAHLIKRLESDRRLIIPWLESVGTLKGKSILEIGCGTGTSTVAIAEQGANVTGIDIDTGALVVAKDRAKIYNLDIEYKELNADKLKDTFGVGAFDIIIFFACLEHMTIEERLSSLKDAWEMLSSKGLLVIVETPNRLWYFDDHTSNLPFFHWLPDQLAFKYSKHSPKETFRDIYREYDEKSNEHFLRRGRGMSFHEIELAISPIQDLDIISSLSTFQGIKYKLIRTKQQRAYKSLIKKSYPAIHDGFFDIDLDLIIQKK